MPVLQEQLRDGGLKQLSNMVDFGSNGRADHIDAM